MHFGVWRFRICANNFLNCVLSESSDLINLMADRAEDENSTKTDWESDDELPRWVRIGDVKHFPARTDVRVRGRRITILRIPEGATSDATRRTKSYVAVDSVCYHAAGPLGSQG